MSDVKPDTAPWSQTDIIMALEHKNFVLEARVLELEAKEEKRKAKKRRKKKEAGTFTITMPKGYHDVAEFYKEEGADDLARGER